MEPREKSRTMELLQSAMERLSQKQIPAWVHVDAAVMRGTIQALPQRDDITVPFQEQLIVELYSK